MLSTNVDPAVLALPEFVSAFTTVVNGLLETEFQLPVPSNECVITT